MFKKMKQNEKGFTLVELVVVIAILAVLCTLFVPQILKNTADARKTTNEANVRTLASDITIYNVAQEDKELWIEGELIDYKEETFKNKDNSWKIDMSGRDWPCTKECYIKVDSNGNAIMVKKST